MVKFYIKPAINFTQITHTTRSEASSYKNTHIAKLNCRFNMWIFKWFSLSFPTVLASVWIKYLKFRLVRPNYFILIAYSLVFKSFGKFKPSITVFFWQEQFLTFYPSCQTISFQGSTYSISEDMNFVISL